MQTFFRKFAERTSAIVGSAWTFLLAFAVVLVWAVTGPLFGYSNTWQLVINTGTTIVTFLMVFLIQNTQNRDSRAIHLKLDELLRAQRGARDDLVDLEELTDDQLDVLHQQFQHVHEEAMRRGSDGLRDASQGLRHVSRDLEESTGNREASQHVQEASESLVEASDHLEHQEPMSAAQGNGRTPHR